MIRTQLNRRSASALRGLGLVALMALAVACGGGGGSGVVPMENPLSVSSGYEPVSNNGGQLYGDGGGDGSGGGGGGDGGGAGAGGGLGAFTNAVITVMRVDGLQASAPTDGFGMVSIKNSGDKRPLLITATGATDASYWDEALQRQVPFPADKSMHVMVAPSGNLQTLSKNVGITPLTEAAYQYAVATLGGADAWKIPANVIKANHDIAAEFNRFLPSTRAIDDITRLPGLAHDATTQVFGGTSPNDSYGLTMAGLARSSNLQNTASTAPALDLNQQLTNDLADGHLDGVGPGNVPVAPPGEATYTVSTLAANTLTGMQNVAAVNGTAQQFPTYALGGTITGLGADGLVLANGGATVALLANATTFSLGHTLVTGSTYAVTVQTQPVGFNCTVANASGTTAAADVGTPVVSCVSSIAHYGLSGNITGLTAGGLVLANGGVTLPVDANATTFTFGSVLVSGGTYNVTVQTAPDGLTCTVTNGSGTAGTADIATPSVGCAPIPVVHYVLRGAIAGLTGSGLQLANGAQTTSVDALASAFTFGQVLTAGSTYSITVPTQPAGQTCTVTNASGTAGTADVTNPLVTCVNSTYTLGGSISGLTATGLQLANGDATLYVDANSTAFNFGAVLQSGTAYSITVRTQPAGLVCTVADGSGTATTANVGNVAVSCLLAAPSLVAGSPTASGFVDGTGDQARFNEPWGLAVDAAGNVYVSDIENYAVRKITSAGVVTTLAGSGTRGYVEGTGTSASFEFVDHVLSFDNTGTLYVNEPNIGDGEGGGQPNRIRRVTPEGATSTYYTTPAGSALEAVVDSAAGIIYRDFAVCGFYRTTPTTSPVLLAGGGGCSATSPTDGTGASATFASSYFFPPFTLDAAGNVYINEVLDVASSVYPYQARVLTYSAVRKLSPTGVVTTLAGGVPGFADGNGTSAKFSSSTIPIAGMSVAPDGSVYVADQGNLAIRRIAPNGDVTTVFGGPNQVNFAGSYYSSLIAVLVANNKLYFSTFSAIYSMPLPQ